MFDTVTFTLHHCQAKKSRAFLSESEYQNAPYLYPSAHRLYLALKEYDNKYIERRIDLTHNQVVDNKTPIDVLGRKVVKRSYIRSPKTLLVSSDKEIMYTNNTFGKATLTSSNYNILFNMKSDQDAIEFTFSIPKYLYGHSIAQYLPNQNSHRFMRSPSKMLSNVYQSEISAERLTEFIEVFLTDLGYMFNFKFTFHPEQIEIRRLDVCFNQICSSKSQALALIEAQKKIYRKRLRKDNKTNDLEDTSLYYRNSKRTFFFKIYHKGSEFNKVGDSDFKRLMKFNQDFYSENFHTLKDKVKALSKYLADSDKKMHYEAFFNVYKTSASRYINIDFVRAFEKLMPYKVFFLLCEADKIVRYEMQFTNTYLTSVYKRNVYCKTSREYKILKKTHSRCQQYYNHINKGHKSKADVLRGRYNLTKQRFNEYEAFHNFLSRKNTFWLKCSSSIEHLEHHFFIKDRLNNSGHELGEKSKKNRVEASTEATFSADLCKSMYDVFMHEVNFFQIKNISNPMSLLDKVDKYNSTAVKRKADYIDKKGQKAYNSLTRSSKMKMDLIEFNRSRLETFLNEFDKGLSLQQIKERYNMKKSAYYDLRNILKKFSLNEQKLKSKYDFSLLRTDYLDYYRLLNNGEYNRQFFAPDSKVAMSSDSHLFKWSA